MPALQQYSLDPVMNNLTPFLESLDEYPETITGFPSPDTGRLPRAYISRISFFPIGDPPDFDTVSEFLLLDYLNESKRVWTAHKSVRRGDIIFFVLAGSALKELRTVKKIFDDSGYQFPHPWARLYEWTKQNAKKLIAYSYYLGEPKEIEDMSHTRWKQQARLGKIQFLRKSLPITQLDYSSVPTAREEIVGGLGTDMNPHRYLSTASFDLLQKEIIKHNPNKALQEITVATFGKYAEISSENWMEKIPHYDDFWAECHVREIFVDELLRRLSDDGLYHAECGIMRNKVKTGKFVDYVIRAGGRWMPVEVKYNAKSVIKRLEQQVKQYIDCEAILKNGECVSIPHKDILVIDRDRVWLWRNGEPNKTPILSRHEITPRILKETKEMLAWINRS